MSDITIPDAALEAAYHQWRRIDPIIGTGDVRLIIAAAAPYIAAQALRDAADIWQTNGWTGDGSVLGPSRPQQILGMAQRACDFLRARAARIEEESHA